MTDRDVLKEGGLGDLQMLGPKPAFPFGQPHYNLMARLNMNGGDPSVPTRALIGEAYDEIERLRNIIYDLNSRLSNGTRDAERYRWLRSEDAATDPRYYKFWREFEVKLCREGKMDALIDAAMRGEPDLTTAPPPEHPHHE